MRVFHDMELDDEAKLDFCAPMACKAPDYPYGLKICLTDKELEKCGCDPKSFEKDGYVHLHAMARITYVTHTDDSEKGKTTRVELQIEGLALESEDEEDETENED